MDPFIYHGVSSNEVRALTLLPGDGGDLSGYLSNVELVPNTTLEFEALSYVWGSLADGEAFSVRDSPSSPASGIIPIGPNLATALR